MLAPDRRETGDDVDPVASHGIFQRETAEFPTAVAACLGGTKPARHGLGGLNQSAPLAGFEPATTGLEIPCSIQLSYKGEWDETLATPTMGVRVRGRSANAADLGSSQGPTDPQGPHSLRLRSNLPAATRGVIVMPTPVPRKLRQVSRSPLHTDLRGGAGGCRRASGWPEPRHALGQTGWGGGCVQHASHRRGLADYDPECLEFPRPVL
jgi:hypothetical protein